MATEESFDMINADLFLSYRRGAGSLYSLEHYEIMAKRLNPDGVFVQWLPLYQITSDEFGVIARTILEAFDKVTMWRNNFYPGAEKVALIGSRGFLEHLLSRPIPHGKGTHQKSCTKSVLAKPFTKQWWRRQLAIRRMLTRLGRLSKNTGGLERDKRSLSPHSLKDINLMCSQSDFLHRLVVCFHRIACIFRQGNTLFLTTEVHDE